MFDDLHEGILGLFAEAAVIGSRSILRSEGGRLEGVLGFSGGESQREWAWRPPPCHRSGHGPPTQRDKRNAYRRRIDLELRAKRAKYTIIPTAAYAHRHPKPLPFIDWAFYQREANRLCSPTKPCPKSPPK